MSPSPMLSPGPHTESQSCWRVRPLLVAAEKSHLCPNSLCLGWCPLPGGPTVPVEKWLFMLSSHGHPRISIPLPFPCSMCLTAEPLPGSRRAACVPVTSNSRRTCPPCPSSPAKLCQKDGRLVFGAPFASDHSFLQNVWCVLNYSCLGRGPTRREARTTELGRMEGPPSACPGACTSNLL